MPTASSGIEVVARATPDGSVLGISNAAHTVNAGLIYEIAVNPVRDFAAVTELDDEPRDRVRFRGSAKSVKELIAIARQSPGKLNAAIAGATGEIATNALKLQAKVDIRNIPYKGGVPAVVAIVWANPTSPMNSTMQRSRRWRRRASCA